MTNHGRAKGKVQSANSAVDVPRTVRNATYSTRTRSKISLENQFFFFFPIMLVGPVAYVERRLNQFFTSGYAQFNRKSLFKP